MGTLKICPKCGQQNRYEAKFCRNCGVVLDTPEQSNLRYYIITLQNYFYKAFKIFKDYFTQSNSKQIGNLARSLAIAALVISIVSFLTCLPLGFLGAIVAFILGSISVAKGEKFLGWISIAIAILVFISAISASFRISSLLRFDKCFVCGGSGEVDCIYCVNGYTQYGICSFCNGYGYRICTFCNGTGKRR